jgi:hypothetical protein
MLSQASVRYFLYLIIYRTGAGNWFVFMRSLAHADHFKHVQVSIVLRISS